MTILLTAAGYQGAYDLVKRFQLEDWKVIGTDMNPKSAARFYCDKFYAVPPASYHFVTRIKSIQVRNKVNMILPGSSCDAEALWEVQEELPVIISKYNLPLDKAETYRKLKNILELPTYIRGKYVDKPAKGKGARGIKYNEGFVMEQLDGEQIDVDVLSLNGELLIAEPKTRERAYGGTMMEGEIVNRPELVELIKKALKVFPLDYLSVWQFIGGKLLEINPRIAGAIIDHELPVMAVKLALGQIKSNEIKNYKVPFGKRIARYMINHYE